MQAVVWSCGYVSMADLSTIFSVNFKFMYVAMAYYQVCITHNYVHFYRLSSLQSCITLLGGGRYQEIVGNLSRDQP